MQDDFSIRQAANNDVSTIKKIVFTVLHEYGLQPDETGKDRDLNDIEKNYLQQNGFFGVVLHTATGNVKGTFGLYKIDSGTCELRKMYLLKESRGKGAGKLMMDYSIAKAKAKGYKRITLETVSPLKEAIRLYKNYGFKEIQPTQISDRVDMAFELWIV